MSPSTPGCGSYADPRWAATSASHPETCAPPVDRSCIAAHGRHSKPPGARVPAITDRPADSASQPADTHLRSVVVTPGAMPPTTAPSRTMAHRVGVAVRSTSCQRTPAVPITTSGVPAVTTGVPSPCVTSPADTWVGTTAAPSSIAAAIPPPTARTVSGVARTRASPARWGSGRRRAPRRSSARSAQETASSPPVSPRITTATAMPESLSKVPSTAATTTATTVRPSTGHRR